MTDSVRLPHLHLFSSARNRSPTKQFIDYQHYKVSRDFVPFRQHSPLRIPIPEPIPIPVPIPPPYESLYQRPIPLILPRHTHQFIRAPSTYLDYAEEYLMGRPLPIYTGSETARFIGPRGISTSRMRNNFQNGCECSDERHHHEAYIRRNATEIPKEHKKTPQKPYNNNANSKPKPADPKQPRKQPYINIDTQRNKKPDPIPTPQPNINIHELFEDRSLVINENRNNSNGNINIINNETQTNNNKRSISHFQYQYQPEHQPNPNPNPNPNNSNLNINQNKSQINNQSHSRQKRTQIIKRTTIGSSQNFKNLISQRFEQFNRIDIQFEDIPYVDFSELQDKKDQYVQSSREILLRLNHLSQDRVETNLVYQLLHNNSGVIWPDI